MTRKNFSVKDHIFNSKDQLFLDANVWLFLYGPQKPDDPKVNIYSEAFSKILLAKSTIYIDVLVISEFINTYARIEFKMFNKKYTDFKKFRDSLDFKPIAKKISPLVNRILSQSVRIDDGFSKIKMIELLNQYSEGKSDFNDQIIIEVCKKEGLTLITHDGDFHGQGIPLITANKNLLKSNKN
jgi:predicted nucleic acid-binding protein